MKAYRFACIAVFLILGFVIANTLFLTRYVGSLLEDVENCSYNSSAEELRGIHQKFMRGEDFAGLTVSHEDLTSIEDLFSELIACAEVGDSDGLTIAKSRLNNALMHLRRLVGFNIDSIF